MGAKPIIKFQTIVLFLMIFASPPARSEQPAIVKSYDFSANITSSSAHSDTVFCSLFRPDMLDLRTSNEIALKDVPEIARDLEIRCSATREKLSSGNDDLTITDILRKDHGFLHRIPDDTLSPFLLIFPKWADEHISFYLSFEQIFRFLAFSDNAKDAKIEDYIPMVHLQLPKQSVDLANNTVQIFSRPTANKRGLIATTLTVFEKKTEPASKIFFQFIRLDLHLN